MSPIDYADSIRFSCELVRKVYGKSGIAIPVSSENQFIKLKKSERRKSELRFGN